MTNPNISELSREFHELIGAWVKLADPSDAREIIRVMRERDDYYKFVERIGGSVDWERQERNWWYAIPDKYVVNTTGLLLQEAVRFMRKEKS